MTPIARIADECRSLCAPRHRLAATEAATPVSGPHRRRPWRWHWAQPSGVVRPLSPATHCRWGCRTHTHTHSHTHTHTQKIGPEGQGFRSSRHLAVFLSTTHSSGPLICSFRITAAFPKRSRTWSAATSTCSGSKKPHGLGLEPET